MDTDVFFFFQAEDGIRDADVTGVQTCALPISHATGLARSHAVVRAPARGRHPGASRAWRGWLPAAAALGTRRRAPAVPVRSRHRDRARLGRRAAAAPDPRRRGPRAHLARWAVVPVRVGRLAVA